MDKKNLSISKEKIHLNNLITDLSDSILMKVQEKNGPISFNLDAKQDLIIADKMHLTNVIYNLLDNALKYSDGDLQIALQDDGTIIISNTASKLNDVQVGRLFDRFFTVEAARNSSGLGLAIAKNLVEQMGGSIAASYHNWVLSITVQFN